MGLTYQSTRGGETGVSASMAILQGLAKDGGLFMPTEIPKPVSYTHLKKIDAYIFLCIKPRKIILFGRLNHEEKNWGSITKYGIGGKPDSLWE